MRLRQIAVVLVILALVGIAGMANRVMADPPSPYTSLNGWYAPLKLPWNGHGTGVGNVYIDVYGNASSGSLKTVIGGATCTQSVSGSVTNEVYHPIGAVSLLYFDMSLTLKATNSHCGNVPGSFAGSGTAVPERGESNETIFNEQFNLSGFGMLNGIRIQLRTFGRLCAPNDGDDPAC